MMHINSRTLTVIFLSALLATPVFGAALQGKVVGISDGDTITLLDANNREYKIRLAGIDAPEKSQAFGTRSKQHLSDLVFGKSVVVDWNKTDKYGRTIGKVLVSGQNANLNQVKAGMAWHYKEYEKEQSAVDRDEYSKAEAMAHTQRLGLWSDPHPIPPWDFRHGTGQASPVARAESGENCPCGDNLSCVGPKGGHYCITTGGKKRYH